MYSTRLIELLLVALSIISVGQSMMVDANILGRNIHALVERQKTTNTDTSRAIEATTSAKSTGTTSVPTTSSPPTSSTPPPTSTPTTPTSTTPPPPPPPATSSTPTTPGSTLLQTSSTPTTSSSSSQSVLTSTTVFTTTDAAGSPTTSTSETTTTPTASLAGQNGASPSAMTTQTRNTIIGVVVGVGGAIILGVIALVAWRIWGRKKAPEEGDGYQYGTPYAPVEKSDAGGTSSTATGRTPFQSTLESYHAPTQVNTASNF